MEKIQMNDYNESKGSIWEVFYLTKSELQLDPTAEQNILDYQTREISASTFEPPPNLSPAEYSQLFMNHFLKSREKSREIISKNKERTTRYKMLVQVGNEECIRDLLNVEQLIDFKGWENPPIVSYFRQISKDYLR